MPAELLPAISSASATRAIRTWLNTCPALPTGVTVSFEDLKADAFGICFSTDQGPIYAARYISGGYRAEYSFRLICRVQPTDDGDMLDAVELLTDLCAWCETTAAPTLEEAVNVRVKRKSDAAVLAAYEDGCTDYNAELTITWEAF